MPIASHAVWVPSGSILPMPGRTRHAQRCPSRAPWSQCAAERCHRRCGCCLPGTPPCRAGRQTMASKREHAAEHVCRTSLCCAGFLCVFCQALFGMHTLQSLMIRSQAGFAELTQFAQCASLCCCRYEMEIKAIRLLDFYGGPSNVKPDAYFAAQAAVAGHALA